MIDEVWDAIHEGRMVSYGMWRMGDGGRAPAAMVGHGGGRCSVARLHPLQLPGSWAPEQSFCVDLVRSIQPNPERASRVIDDNVKFVAGAIS